MPTTETPAGGERSASDLLAGVVLLAGIGLVGAGSYVHLTVAAEASAGRCDGCEPWHPLIVVTPLVVGSGFVLLGGYLLTR
ncbi:hypothetical protein [Salinigranum salinum]|uniref:hypothetical protein n=1 Tax=Salinigranum salinum TaxID=1364937 RepID=UPI001260CD39|nr:hypothetical protein [Salinigranum salinum]